MNLNAFLHRNNSAVLLIERDEQGEIVDTLHTISEDTKEASLSLILEVLEKYKQKLFIPQHSISLYKVKVKYIPNSITPPHELDIFIHKQGFNPTQMFSLSKAFFKYGNLHFSNYCKQAI